LSIAPSPSNGRSIVHCAIPGSWSCVGQELRPQHRGLTLKKKGRKKNDFIIRTVYKSSVDGRADQTNFLLEKKFSYPQLFICKSHEYMIY